MCVPHHQYPFVDGTKNRDEIEDLVRKVRWEYSVMKHWEGVIRVFDPAVGTGMELEMYVKWRDEAERELRKMLKEAGVKPREDVEQMYREFIEIYGKS